MDTSSMMMISISRKSFFLSLRYRKCCTKSTILLPKLLSILSKVGRKGRSGKPNIEWMVTPPALMAAIPVGATTMCFFLVFLTNSFRKVVFPVPALPVKKILRWVCSTKLKRDEFIFQKYS